jgi:hypothetical protein
LEFAKQTLYCLNYTFSPFLEDTWVYTQGLMLARPALHHTFFVVGFFKLGSHRLFARGMLQTVILLISAS